MVSGLSLFHSNRLQVNLSINKWLLATMRQNRHKPCTRLTWMEQLWRRVLPPIVMTKWSGFAKPLIWTTDQIPSIETECHEAKLTFNKNHFQKLNWNNNANKYILTIEQKAERCRLRRWTHRQSSLHSAALSHMKHFSVFQLILLVLQFYSFLVHSSCRRRRQFSRKEKLW